MCSFRTRTQSRFSLYAEYPSLRKAPKHPCSQRCFNFSLLFKFGQRSWKYEWSFILMRCPVSLSAEKSAKSCNVNIKQSLALTKNVNKTSWKHAEPRKRYCFSSAFRVCDSRRSETQTHKCYPFFHPNTPVLLWVPRSLGSALHFE